MGVRVWLQTRISTSRFSKKGHIIIEKCFVQLGCRLEEAKAPELRLWMTGWCVGCIGCMPCLLCLRGDLSLGTSSWENTCNYQAEELQWHEPCQGCNPCQAVQKQAPITYMKAKKNCSLVCRIQPLAAMLAATVAWLAQLPPQQKLAVLLGAYGFSAAPLLFWIAWRVITQLRGTQKVRAAPVWLHAGPRAAVDRQQCLLLDCFGTTAGALARSP